MLGNIFYRYRYFHPNQMNAYILLKIKHSQLSLYPFLIVTLIATRGGVPAHPRRVLETRAGVSITGTLLPVFLTSGKSLC